jgi:pimeloyl-ACP methyl ester carboxylesterase
VPFLYEQSYQWFTSFDDLGETIERPNPTPALQHLSKIMDHLINDCAWPIHRIHFFGFAQGGSVAAEFGVHYWKQQQQLRSSQAETSGQESVPLLSFGSIVTVSGPLLSYPTISTLSPTPILVAHRSPPSDMALSPGAFNAFNKAFSSATESKMEAKGMGMPASKREWDPIMRFWSRHLSRRQVEGLYEIMTGSGN